LANIKASEKDIRRIRKRNEINSQRRSELRTLYKKVVKSIDTGSKDIAVESFRLYTKAMDTAARKGLIKKTNASRHKSRLALRINKISA